MKDILIKKYKHGEVRFCDCMDILQGLQSLEDKSRDLGITDIPFGVDLNTKGKIKGKWDNLNKESIKYKDIPQDHKELMRNVFNEFERICNGFIIYCGGVNLSFFITLKKPRQVIYRYASNCFSNGSLSFRRTIFPMVCYGKFNNRVGNDLFDYPSRSGWYRNNNMIHPCPLNMDFWTDLIYQIKPDSILDPFLGSGTTAEVCEKLGIPWLGYELNEVYLQDIEKRLHNIKVEPKQVSLTNF